MLIDSVHSGHRAAPSFFSSNLALPSMASLSLRTRSRLLSNTDASILKDYGRNTTQDLTRIISETIFLSIYGVFFALAVYSILRRGLRSRISIIMLLVVMYLFGASMVQWVVDLFQLIKNFHNLFTTTDVPIPDRIDLAVDTFEKFALLQELLFVLNMIIADAVVIWRTWAVWQGRIAAIVMPCVLLLAAFVFVLIDITCNAYDGTKPLPGGGVICPQASKTVWALSVTTNIVCTLLIGFKAWQHRKMMKQLNMGRKVRGMSIENILSLLVESGFIYSFLWLIQVIPYLDITRASPVVVCHRCPPRAGLHDNGFVPNTHYCHREFQPYDMGGAPGLTGYCGSRILGGQFQSIRKDKVVP
ncbi:hypothetical protein MSAN_01843900 [Mycena sanguinolenta]|uniref:Uncharacterized protein n=1 Tax=Mycena sanguinolenta TaxID=230812 RepID=A0A8H6XT91_9AGAR|nr:hypothetical protein MSAN_01843900 [Mycena sanguinolenta]